MNEVVDELDHYNHNGDDDAGAEFNAPVSDP